MDLYREKILDHYQNPRRFGKIKKFTHEAEAANDLCGDKLKFRLLIKDNKVKNISFFGEGCAISIASASILAEKALNCDIALLQKMRGDDIVDMLGIKPTPTRLKCALLGLEALQKAAGNF